MVFVSNGTQHFESESESRTTASLLNGNTNSQAIAVTQTFEFQINCNALGRSGIQTNAPLHVFRHFVVLLTFDSVFALKNCPNVQSQMQSWWRGQAGIDQHDPFDKNLQSITATPSWLLLQST